MAQVTPGSVVRHDGEEKIVVDVNGDDYAVLRRTADISGEKLWAVPVKDLVVVGHV